MLGYIRDIHLDPSTIKTNDRITFLSAKFSSFLVDDRTVNEPERPLFSLFHNASYGMWEAKVNLRTQYLVILFYLQVKVARDGT